MDTSASEPGARRSLVADDADQALPPPAVQAYGVLLALVRNGGGVGDGARPSWTVTHASLSTAAILGVAASDLLACDIADLLHPASYPHQNHHNNLKQLQLARIAAAADAAAIATKAATATEAAGSGIRSREGPVCTTLVLAAHDGSPTPCYAAIHWSDTSTTRLIIELDVIANCDPVAWQDHFHSSPSPSLSFDRHSSSHACQCIAPPAKSDRDPDKLYANSSSSDNNVGNNRQSIDTCRNPNFNCVCSNCLGSEGSSDTESFWSDDSLGPVHDINACPEADLSVDVVAKALFPAIPITVESQTVFVEPFYTRFYQNSFKLINLLNCIESALDRLTNDADRFKFIARCVLQLTQYEFATFYKFDNRQIKFVHEESIYGSFDDSNDNSTKVPLGSSDRYVVPIDIWNYEIINCAPFRAWFDAVADSSNVIGIAGEPPISIDYCILRPIYDFARQRYVKQAIQGAIAVYVHYFGKPWGSISIRSTRKRRLPFECYDVLVMTINTLSKFLERNIMHSQLQMHQQLTSHTFKHVVAGAGDLLRGAGVARTQTFVSTSSSVKETPLYLRKEDAEAALERAFDNRPLLLTEDVSKVTKSNTITNTTTHDDASAAAAEAAETSIDANEAAEIALRESAIHEAAEYLASCVGDLLGFLAADAVLLVVGSIQHVVGPSDLKDELLVVAKRLESNRLSTITTCSDLMKEWASVVGSVGDEPVPVFEHLAGMLLVPLSSFGDAFMCFFRKKAADGNVTPAVNWPDQPTAPDDTHPMWSVHDVNVARLVQVLYWWFISAFQEREVAARNDRLRNFMLETVGREIRSPLNAIINYLEMMLEKPLTETDLREYVREAHAASRSLSHTISEMLFLTQMDAGKAVMRSEVFALGPLIRRTVEAFRSDATAKGLNLDVTIDTDLDCDVAGDATQLRQLVSALCDNAVWFTHHGVVAVRCRQAAGSTSTNNTIGIELTIEDTGVGMSVAALQVVRAQMRDPDSIQPIHVTPSRAGLGIIIVSRLLRQLRGLIAFRSAEGAGTTVSIRLNFIRSGRGGSVSATHGSSSGGGVSTSSYSATDTTPSSAVMTNTSATTSSLLVSSTTGASHLRRSVNHLGSVTTPLPPRPPPQSSSLLSLSSTSHTSQPVKLTILVVDDNVINQQVLSRRLTKDGHRVMVAATGEEALEMYLRHMGPVFGIGAVTNHYIDTEATDGGGDGRDHEMVHADTDTTDTTTLTTRIHLILMDMHMPGWSGPDTTRHICTHEQSHSIHPPTPIVGVSGAVTDTDRDACRDSGMTGFLPKPVDFRVLRSVVDDVVDVVVNGDGVFRSGGESDDDHGRQPYQVWF